MRTIDQAARERADQCKAGYPERVVYDDLGRADSGRFSMIQLLRKDGWNLGAVLGLEHKAFKLWKGEWGAWREVDVSAGPSGMSAVWGPWKSLESWPAEWK